MNRAPAVALLTVLLCSCAGTLPAGPAEPVAAPAAYPQHVARILAEANRARATANLRPLTASAPLDQAADEHARELAVRGVLDHTSITPGRETMTQRIEAAGGTWVNAAENLFSYSGPLDDQLATQAVSAWLRSPGHRVNLLDGRYTHSGVGVARDRAGTWYVVQLYVLPRPTR